MSEVQSTDNPTLEKLIREVDYVKMGENYIPSKFAIKFINFIKLVNGEDEKKINLLFSIMIFLILFIKIKTY